MQDFDPIEERFRNAFSGRESEPPENSGKRSGPGYRFLPPGREE